MLTLQNTAQESEGLVSSDLIEVVRRAYTKLAQQELQNERVIREIPRIASAKLKVLLSIISFFGGGYALYQAAGKPLIHWCQNNGIDYYLRKFLREPLTAELIEKVAQGHKERTVYAYRVIRNLIMLCGWKFLWPIVQNTLYQKTLFIPQNLQTIPSEEMLLEAIREIKAQKEQLGALQRAAAHQ